MTKEEILEKYELSEESLYEECLLDFYSHSIAGDEKLQFVYDDVLNLLKEACRKRNISYNSNSEELLLSLLDEYNQDSYFKDTRDRYSFDYKWFAVPDKIEDFLSREIIKCETADDLEDFLRDFEIIYDEFRAFFAKQYLGHFMVDLFELKREKQRSVEEIEVVEDTWVNLDSLVASSEAEETNSWDDFFDEADWDGTWEGEWADDLETEPFEAAPKHELTDDLIKEYMEFFITAYFVNAIYVDCKRVSNQLYAKIKELKLKEFKDKPEFIEDLNSIMSHDKTAHRYHYHGTQDVGEMTDANKIMEEGLLITSDLAHTSYPEFNMEELLLYYRGFGGEIGRYGIVIIDQPIIDGKPLDIIKKLEDGEEYSFVPSGLQGLDNKPEYIVLPEYIVGYVDKYNKKVVYNPLYYDYENKVGKDHEM